jgi:hypothetical protein
MFETRLLQGDNIARSAIGRRRRGKGSREARAAQMRFITVKSHVCIALTLSRWGVSAVCGAVGTMSKSVTPDQYSALRRLADVLRGIVQTLMLAYGFRDE